MRRDLLIGLVLALLTLAVYGRVSQFDFVNYDDNDYVTANVHVQGGLTKAGVAWAFGRIHGENTYWHPITWLSHMVDCQLFGLKAGAHHLVNVLLHTVNALLLFWLLNRTTGALWRSAVVAALFALHPLQVDTVAWVTERKNVLSTLFWLLTTLAYVRYVERPGVLRYALVLLLFALGLMCKPILVTLPCVLLLLDFWPLRRLRLVRPGHNAVPAKATLSPGSQTQATVPALSFGRLVLEKLPLLALSLASSFITILAHRGLGLTEEAYGLPFRLRLENAAVSYARYIGKMIWPENLSVLYIHPGQWPASKVSFSLVVLLGLSLLVVWRRRRSPYLLVGWLWFLGVLVPAIGLRQVGIQSMADRFAYVPVIGLFLMIVWGVSDLVAGWRHRRMVLAVGTGALLAACLLGTARQLRHWKNSIALFTRALQVDDKNFLAHNNLAAAFLDARQLEEARHHAAEGLRLRPNFAECHLKMGVILNLQRQPAEAMTHFEQALRLRPDWALPHSELAMFLASRGMTADAISHYREALRLNPDWPETLNNLAWLLATHPDSALRNGAEAVRLAERACELTRGQRTIFVGTLAAAYAEAGRFAEAVKTARQAHKLALSAGETELARKNVELMDLYQAKRAFRETQQ